MSNQSDSPRRRFLSNSAKGAGAIAMSAFLEACKSRGFNTEKSGALTDSRGSGAVRVRKAWSTLSAEEKDLYRKAVSLLHAEKVTGKPYRSQFQRLAYVHENSCPHGNWFFLPWHRDYLGLYESELVRVLREKNVDGHDSFALPYWNWTDTPAIPVEFKGTALDPAILYGGEPNFAIPRYYNSDTRTVRPEIPMPEQAVGPKAVALALAATDFYQFACYPSAHTNFSRDDFRAAGTLESVPHNTVHGTIGGHMGAFLSPLDPIFWLHHCNIDRLWNEWMKGQNDILPYQPESDAITIETRRGSLVIDMVVKDARGEKVQDYRKYWLDYQFRLDAGPRAASDVLHHGTRTSDLIDSTTFRLPGVPDSHPYCYDTDPAPAQAPAQALVSKAIESALARPTPRRRISKVAFKEQQKAVSSTTFSARIGAAEAEGVLVAFASAVAANKKVGAYIVVTDLPVPADGPTRNAVQVRMRVADADTLDKEPDLRSELGVISFFTHGGHGDHGGHGEHAKDTNTVSLDVTEWLRSRAAGAPVRNVWVSGTYEKKQGFVSMPAGWERFKAELPSRLKDAQEGIQFTLVVRAEV